MTPNQIKALTLKRQLANSYGKHLTIDPLVDLIASTDSALVALNNLNKHLPGLSLGYSSFSSSFYIYDNNLKLHLPL